jgi:hypothetical protein
MRKHPKESLAYMYGNERTNNAIELRENPRRGPEESFERRYLLKLALIKCFSTVIVLISGMHGARPL